MLFSSIPGQETLKTHLIKEIQLEKISHAKLFTGKAGYGTLPLALAYVQYLFCEQKQATDSCGTCPSCKKVNELQHPDIHFSFPTITDLSKTSDRLLPKWREQLKEQPYFSVLDWVRRLDNKDKKPIIGSEESLEIIKKLALKSFEGGYKVMIIWIAEMMNATCANKLLKILEEPPAKTLFILIAEDPNKLLVTIQSRTQQIRMTPFSVDDIQKALMQAGVQSQLAESVAVRSHGDLIEAQELVNNSGDEHIYRELFIQLMRVCFKKNVNEMLDWTEDVSKLSREEQKLFTLYALHMIRQSNLANYTDNMLVTASKEERQFLEKFARFITNNNLYDFIELFDQAHYHLDRNAAPKLLFTQLCFQIMRFIHKS